MKIAVLSDIHGNAEALRAVFLHMDRQKKIDQTFCLGDTVGYGPDSSICLGLLRARKIVSVLGNQEVALLQKKARHSTGPLRGGGRGTVDDSVNDVATQDYDADVSSLAGSGTKKTPVGVLSDLDFEYIQSLNPYLVFDEYRFVHGSPPHSQTKYLSDWYGKNIRFLFEQFSENLCFVGHTHTLEIITCDTQGIVARIPLVEEPVTVPRTTRAVINVGSVGQPRDGDRRARYVTVTNFEQKRIVQAHYVEYNRTATIQRLQATGIAEDFIRPIR